jgi:hypothetical protein
MIGHHYVNFGNVGKLMAVSLPLAHQHEGNNESPRAIQNTAASVDGHFSGISGAADACKPNACRVWQAVGCG